MLFEDYLTNRAAEYIWCNPNTDNNVILELSRLTYPSGAYSIHTVTKETLGLPGKSPKTHVFQIGQLWPTKLKLFPIEGFYTDTEWFKISDVCTANNLFLEIYNSEGIHQPLHRSWYRFTREHDLIICLEDAIPVKIDYKRDKIYLRMYKNPYFETERYKSGVHDEEIIVAGDTIVNKDQIIDWQVEYNKLKENYEGYIFAYVNGEYIDEINVSTVKIGDIIEIVADPTVRKIIDLDIGELATFESKVDKGNHKYILHYPDDGSNYIEHCSNNEHYVVHKYNVAGNYIGRYYSKNRIGAVRMLTHRDYSIYVDNVRHLAGSIRSELEKPVPIEDMYIRIFIREPVSRRPLEYVNNRIHELYTLSDEDIVRCMTGIDSTVPIWTARELEANPYVYLMGLSRLQDITRELAELVYGYNGMSVIMGNSPIKTYKSGNDTIAKIESSINKNCTVYEYNEEGVMLGAYHHRGGVSYICEHQDCYIVETYYGEGTKKPNVIYGKNDIKIPANETYRVYCCYNYKYDSGDDKTEWTDITDSEHITIENNIVKWNLSSDTHMLMVRVNDKFLMYDLSLKPSKGLLTFTLSEITTIENVTKDRPMTVAMGELDIYLNGKNLIEGIDYFVDFPDVIITNKEYLRQPYTEVNQSIHVRFCGYCNKDLTRDRADDLGYVMHGALSNNGVYDIRNDRVMHIVVRGNTKHKDDIKVSEFTYEPDILNKLNGSPYMLRDILVPFNIESNKLMEYRKQSMEIDKMVSDYMTIKYPEPDKGDISAIPEKYKLVSPFFSRIIYGVLNNEFDFDNINIKDTNAIKEAVKGYIYLIKYDPIGNEADNKFLSIHPCLDDVEQTVNVIQLRFIKKLVTIYGKGYINLTSFLKSKKD